MASFGEPRSRTSVGSTVETARRSFAARVDRLRWRNRLRDLRTSGALDARCENQRILQGRPRGETRRLA